MSGDTPHITPFKTYVNILLILLVLTVVTVAAAQVDTGILHTPIAMLIASVKAYFVLAFFMHLNVDDKLYRAIFGVSIFFLALLYVILYVDWSTRVLEVSPL